MPFNGSGGFTRLRNWVNDAAAAIKIRADLHDQEDDNLAAGLSNVICKDGQTTITADIPMSGRKLTNVGAPTAGGDAANKTYSDLKVLKAGDTMTGDLTISKAGPLLMLNKAASGQLAAVQGQKAALARWLVQFGDSAAEGGANAGSDFRIDRYNDAGTYTDTPLLINRATGQVTLPNQLNVGNSIVVSVGNILIPAAGNFYQNGVLNWVSRSYLKSTAGGINVANTILVSVLPGGAYGFAPVCYANVTEGHIAGPAFASNASTPGTLQNTGTTTAGSQYYIIGRSATGTQYADQQYIQASPPYDMGDGEVPLFTYALIDNGSGLVLGAWTAPDPPWAYNGPTNITPDIIAEDGKAYRRIKDVKLDGLSPREAAIALHEAPFIDVEIDMAMKNADMDLIPHPWIADPAFLDGTATPVLLDPMSHLMPVLNTLREQRGPSSVLDLIHTNGVPNAIVVGNTGLKRAGPQGLKIVSAAWR